MRREEYLRVVRDLLLLVSSPVPLVVMREWSGWEVTQVEDWALSAHLKAGDNDVRVPPVPAVLRAYVRETAAQKTAAAKARFRAHAEKGGR
jgi:hypothetical protein